VTIGTHIIGNSKSNNGSNEEHEQSINEGLGEVSNKFMWQNIDSFLASCKTFCDVYDP
jgi:hypothetical protein